MARVGLAKVTRKGFETAHSAEIHNMTLLNLYLWYYGPVSEKDLAKGLIKFQVFLYLFRLFVHF